MIIQLCKYIKTIEFYILYVNFDKAIELLKTMGSGYTNNNIFLELQYT